MATDYSVQQRCIRCIDGFFRKVPIIAATAEPDMAVGYSLQRHEMLLNLTENILKLERSPLKTVVAGTLSPDPLCVMVLPLLQQAQRSLCLFDFFV